MTVGTLPRVEARPTSPTGRPRPVGGVCVVLPTRHEPAPDVVRLLTQIEHYCGPAGIVVVDDSEIEYGQSFRAAVRRAFPTADVHVRTGADRQGGLGGAVLAGLTRAAEAGHRFAVVLDADGQHPPTAIPQMLAALAGPEHPDLVVASRYEGGGGTGDGFSRGRAVVSRAATLVSRAAFPSALGRCSDPMSGFFAVRLASLELSGCFADGFKVLMQLMCQHPHLRYAEVSYVFGARSAGTSKASAAEGVRFLTGLVRLRRVVMRKHLSRRTDSGSVTAGSRHLSGR